MRCTEWVHLLIGQVAAEGDLFIDATAGNGHDTLFLARAAGPEGRVHAFDTQLRALKETSRRLREHGLDERVCLHHHPHERMEEALPPEIRGRVAAVLFNLGYLPGSSKEVITRPETTLAALGTAIGWLRPGGVVTVVAYPRHDGGAEEAAAVRKWAADLNSRFFETMEFRSLNKGEATPFGIAVWRERHHLREKLIPPRHPET